METEGKISTPIFGANSQTDGICVDTLVKVSLAGVAALVAVRRVTAILSHCSVGSLLMASCGVCRSVM